MYIGLRKVKLVPCMNVFLFYSGSWKWQLWNWP